MDFSLILCGEKNFYRTVIIFRRAHDCEERREQSAKNRGIFVESGLVFSKTRRLFFETPQLGFEGSLFLDRKGERKAKHSTPTAAPAGKARHEQTG